MGDFEILRGSGMSGDDEMIRMDLRGNITQRDLAILRRRAEVMKKALEKVQGLAQGEIELGVCTSKSAVREIERVAREAIHE